MQHFEVDQEICINRSLQGEGSSASPQGEENPTPPFPRREGGPGGLGLSPAPLPTATVATPSISQNPDAPPTAHGYPDICVILPVPAVARLSPMLALPALEAVPSAPANPNSTAKGISAVELVDSVPHPLAYKIPGILCISHPCKQIPGIFENWYCSLQPCQ